jgi:hypothetical protein
LHAADFISRCTSPNHLFALCCSARIHKLTQVIKARTFDDDAHSHDVGQLCKRCSKCSALHFKGETPGATCCRHGKVSVSDVTLWPAFLFGLFRGYSQLTPVQSQALSQEERDLLLESSTTKHFREHVRQYNSAVAPASLSVSKKHIRGQGPHVVNMQGQCHRYLPHLKPLVTNNIVWKEILQQR